MWVCSSVVGRIMAHKCPCPNSWNQWKRYITWQRREIKSQMKLSYSSAEFKNRLSRIIWVGPRPLNVDEGIGWANQRDGTAHFGDGVRVLWAKEGEWLPEVGKEMEWILPLEMPERNAPCWHLGLTPVRSTLNLWYVELWDINLYSFKPPSFWWFVAPQRKSDLNAIISSRV